jgi:hypothetical protein
MKHGSAALFAAVAVLALSACDGAPPETNTIVAPAATTTATGAASATPAEMPAPTASDSAESLTIDDTAQGAANLIRAYYADLDRGDFRSAYARWGNDGAASHQSFADFKRGFIETAATSVEPGPPGDSEGAAGSIYIDIPVTVHAQLKDGTRQRFTGTYTLRRVNDVPGSTQAQRRWHIYSANLKEG